MPKITLRRYADNPRDDTATVLELGAVEYERVTEVEYVKFNGVVYRWDDEDDVLHSIKPYEVFSYTGLKP